MEQSNDPFSSASVRIAKTGVNCGKVITDIRTRYAAGSRKGIRQSPYGGIGEVRFGSILMKMCAPNWIMCVKSRKKFFFRAGLTNELCYVGSVMEKGKTFDLVRGNKPISDFQHELTLTQWAQTANGFKAPRLGVVVVVVVQSVVRLHMRPFKRNCVSMELSEDSQGVHWQW